MKLNNSNLPFPAANFAGRVRHSKNSQFTIRNSQFGFTLLEVMIAIAIFFIATFAILQLISSGLANARRLQRPMVDASPELTRWAATNIIIEGTYSGSLGDSERLGKAYRDYNYVTVINEISSNHLYSVETVIRSVTGNRDIISDMLEIRYAPLSPPGSLDGGNFVK